MWLRDFECRRILVVIITLQRLQPGVGHADYSVAVLPFPYVRSVSVAGSNGTEFSYGFFGDTGI